MLENLVEKEKIQSVKQMASLKGEKLQEALSFFEELLDLRKNIIDEQEGLRPDSHRMIELDTLYFEVDNLINENIEAFEDMYDDSSLLSV